MADHSDLDVVTMGEAMVLLAARQRGLLRHARQFERYVAGAESNTAIGLARLGHAAGWISRVGDDEFGACVEAEVRGAGVDVSQVVRDAEAPTGVFFKERRRPGHTRVHYYRSGSAASRLAPADVNSRYLRGAQYLHLTGITPALSASCREATQAAVRAAREAGVPVSVDPNVRRKLWPTMEEARAALFELIAGAELVLTSAGEACLLAETDDLEEAARTLQGKGPSVVVVKHGADGAFAIGERDGGHERAHVPAVDTQAVDTIGAGDAFNAGFLSGQLRGWDLEASLRLGAVTGALATAVPGDVEGLPTWAEVQPYLGGESVADR
jgi:2-dehydro-3-deoxygluconokinase